MKTPEEYVAEAHRLFMESTSSYSTANVMAESAQRQALNHMEMAIKLTELEAARLVREGTQPGQPADTRYPALPVPGADVVEGIKAYRAAQDTLKRQSYIENPNG